MADLRLHKERCPICKSQYCKEIDELLMQFESAAEIARRFEDFSEHSVRNHCQVTGISEKRMKNKRIVLQLLIDRGMKNLLADSDLFKLDAGHLIKATELYAKLDGDLVEKTELKFSNLNDSDLDDIEQRIIDSAARRLGDITEDTSGEETPED